MKAVISTTYSDTYLFFLPIVTYCWNKLGVDVICFMPFQNRWDDLQDKRDMDKLELIETTMKGFGGKYQLPMFYAPDYKQATYAQCLRNFGACLDLPEDELLCTSDVDMLVFKKPPYNDCLTVWGGDLVPQGQFPECYITGTVNQWREAFNLNGKTYQQAIDELLGEDECEHYRGNRWSRDQELAHDCISKVPHSLVPRSNGQNQFAQHRLDRDDSFILDRLNLDNVDYHMNRPGYTDANFEIIMKVLAYHYPHEDFTWLVNYNNSYKQLL